MTKRHNLAPLGQGREACKPGGTVWVGVGQRLQRRRTELGLSAGQVAQWGGVPVDSYVGYEQGVPIPASLLAQLSDLFDMPIVWFFQGAADREEEPEDCDPSPDPEPVVYRVATVEQRIQALTDSFRKLDFEGQQHLLAISQALGRCNAAAPRD